MAIGAATTYQQVVVRVSREAVINARVATIRAPMDGIIKTASAIPGRAVQAGASIGDIEDPNADDARVFQLQQDIRAGEREHDALARRLSDLRQSRSEADAQAEAYRIGRVAQDELRVEETRASLAAALARQEDAIAAERRGAALHSRGYMADAAYERALHAREVAQQDTIAARKRLDALTVELQAARNGTYLGDNYNDVPSSFQRSRELTVRIEETEATLDQVARKQETLAAELTAERKRLAARSSASLSAPIEGNLWTVQAASGEYVRKGQELFTVLDCSTVAVTASVSERDYNELRLGDPVRFRVAGSNREYSGTISKLGLTSSGRSFAIAPEERHHQVAIQLLHLQDSDSDRCAVGRTGEVVFESRGQASAGRLVEGLRHFLGLS
ncbi:MAG: HlyD family efflux transporter periplasmic adaptor subunit [Alphaproteobacteria bacterium]|nr:HlyD family efflux transporter periplasmic adaptor subunit [Alphaproteobacteria bacterium]